MKIILLSAPYLPEYMRNARCDFVSLSGTQWYPILLGYCGAYLESKGHEVKLIDAPAHHLNHEMARGIIRNYHPELLVLYTGFMSEKNDLEFTEPLIEELGCEAVIVGPYASIDSEGTLKRAGVINKLIAGEFEYGVGELAAGKDFHEIRSLVFNENGQIVHNPLRANLAGDELDSLPFVSRFFRDHIDIYRYKTLSELYPFMDIMTGRGCKWGFCTYCLWVHTFIKGSTYNVRSIHNVMDEFRFIEQCMPKVRSVMLQDDTFTEERALEFSEAKIKSGIRILWSCYARANINFQTLKLMKKAGCLNLHVGYESSSEQILRIVKKGISVERMTRFTNDAKRAGLSIHGDFLIGLPGERIEDAAKTIRWACRMNPETAQFQLMIPFPGTPLYEHMRGKGYLNSEGQPDMPDFTNQQIRAMAKKAYRDFYLSPQYLWKCIKHPYRHFWSRLNSVKRAVPAMFWKKWKV